MVMNPNDILSMLFWLSSTNAAKALFMSVVTMCANDFINSIFKAKLR